MSQLIKHYLTNRDTGEWAFDIKNGLQMPNIKLLEVKYNILDENDVPFCLSTIPEYLKVEKTILQEELDSYQNNSNITIISLLEKEVENIRPMILENNSSDDVETKIVYDIVYQEPYKIEESEGLKILTQLEWDDEIHSFDKRQEEKRYTILRKLRSNILKLTDWVVVESLEKENTLNYDFKMWRQSLRDLPNSESFPLEMPTPPTFVETLPMYGEIQSVMNEFDEVKSIQMINDPFGQSEQSQQNNYGYETFL